MEENTRLSRHYTLLQEAQCEDEARALAATDTLLAENMGLVRTAAMRFRDRGIEYEDLLQIGTMGMLRAIRSFDLSRGTAFSTFAVPLIVGEIRRSLRDDGIVRVSRSYKQLAALLSKKRREISQRESREPSVEELAASSGVSTEEAAMALAATMPVTSLSEPIYEEEGAELSTCVTDFDSENEPQILSNRLALGEAIGKMPPLWRKILLLRYFRNQTQQQTAEMLGLSQVKVSREEKKILGFLRGEMIV